jgi:hypothetical protein
MSEEKILTAEIEGLTVSFYYKGIKILEQEANNELDARRIKKIYESSYTTV